MALHRYLSKFRDVTRTLPDLFNKSPVSNHMRRAMDTYESYIGVKEIKNIQQNVLKAEEAFVESSKARRIIQDSLLKVQQNLKQIRQKLDSMSRSDEAYLELITNEHKLIKNELNLLNDLRSQEELERELFTSFSQRLREAHEFERLRQEKVKYLSVLGSIIGAFLGILGTSINHTLKMKDINKLVTALEAKMNAISENFINHQQAMASPSTENEENQPEVDQLTKEETIRLEAKLQEATQVIAEELNSIQHSIQLSQQNLEHRMKMNNFVTGLITVGLLVIILPLISRIQS